jgi:hypothetical protein
VTLAQNALSTGMGTSMLAGGSEQASQFVTLTAAP